MPVLDIENRVVAGMLDHFGKVEIERGVVLAVKHIEAHSITADLVDNLAQGDKLAGPFRHFHRLAGTQQAHQLHELHIEIRLAATDRFDSGLHTLDVAAVVGAPDVDKIEESARDL